MSMEELEGQPCRQCGYSPQNEINCPECYPHTYGVEELGDTLQKEFEIMAVNCMFSVGKDVHEEYCSMKTHLLWMGYKKCAERHGLL